ncbi:RNA polymerase sigma factor [Kineococcus terrestris]|uniref:RNA polymerase sigma factor n=1 Tax=Kineococcus terrestris TaxID=2044856 RepID=UPI0034DB2C0E
MKPAASPPAGGVADALADAHRREWAFVLAATVRVAGDLDVAEECAQEAYADAMTAWARSGVPERPGAWLTTTARRRAVDRLRRESTLRRKLPLLVEPVEAGASGSPSGGDADGDADGQEAVPDDRLRLLFTCCHPALDPAARVALTLRLVCGVATPDVARAFLVPEATMAARITRAKKKITQARIPYRTPTAAELPERLDSVLAAVHLLFSTGHTAPTGEQLVRDDLCERALDLARTLVRLLPAERETRGLLGLLLLTHARRAARLDAWGRLVLLEDQDRQRWDHVGIVEGLRWTVESLQTPRPGRFALQAAIAGAHAVAPTFAATDWARVVHLYDLLLAVEPSPVVELNRAAALAFAEGPAAALGIVERLAGDARLRAYPYAHAVRADLLRRLGRDGEAAAAYRAALDLTANGAEREFLRRRIDDLDAVAATGTDG